MYSSQDAAKFIGTTARLLRRFIRQNDSWKNATHAGRYEFTQEEVETLKKQFETWQGTRHRRERQPDEAELTLAYLDEDPGLPDEMVRRAKHDPKVREMIYEKRRARNAKLMKRLAECGMTVSG